MNFINIRENQESKNNYDRWLATVFFQKGAPVTKVYGFFDTYEAAKDWALDVTKAAELWEDAELVCDLEEYDA